MRVEILTSTETLKRAQTTYSNINNKLAITDGQLSNKHKTQQPTTQSYLNTHLLELTNALKHHMSRRLIQAYNLFRTTFNLTKLTIQLVLNSLKKKFQRTINNHQGILVTPKHQSSQNITQINQ